MREWSRARKCFTAEVTPDIASGRITIVHLLRTYALALQLAAHGRILDYRAAEPMRLELLGYAEREWRWWRDRFEGRLEELHSHLKEAAKQNQDQVEVGA